MPVDRNLERLQFATRNFQRLQKLPWAAVGGVLMLFGSIIWLGGAAARNFSLLCIVIAYSIYMPLNKRMERFYAQRYGTVRSQPAELSDEARLVRSMGIMSISILLVFIIPAYFPSQVKYLWLIVGACVAGAEFHKDFLVHRIIAGLILLGLSIAPVLHMASTDQLAQGWELIVSALALTIIGLGDHWVLVHSLPSVTPEESHG